MSRTVHSHGADDTAFPPDATDIRLSHGALDRPHRRPRPLPPTRRQRMERFVRRLMSDLIRWSHP